MRRIWVTLISFMLLILLILLFLSWMVKAEDASPEAYKNIAALVARTDVKAAIAVSNTEKKNISQLNVKWIQEMKQPKKGALINNFMQTPLSQTLSLLKSNSAQRLDQIMVMDNKGALVAADRPTHDYDQSDEEKWLATVGKHNGQAVHEYSQNRDGYIFEQISQSVTDRNGIIIGAVTIIWRR